MRSQSSGTTIRLLIIALWAVFTTEFAYMLPTDRSHFCWWFTKRQVGRFIRAGKNKFYGAFKKIKATLEWRRRNEVDDALRRGSQVFQAALRLGRNGVLEVMPRTDDDGRAYVVFKPFCGIIDGDATLLAIYTIERALRLAKYTQKLVLIIDCHTKNDALCVPTKAARSITRSLLRHYPDTLAKAVVVGASWRQRLQYMLYATVLPSAVRKKIMFRAWTDYFMPWLTPPYQLDQTIISEDIGGFYPYALDWDEYMDERPWEAEELSVLGSLESKNSDDSVDDYMSSIEEEVVVAVAAAAAAADIEHNDEVNAHSGLEDVHIESCRPPIVFPRRVASDIN